MVRNLTNLLPGKEMTFIPSYSSDHTKNHWTVKSAVLPSIVNVLFIYIPNIHSKLFYFYEFVFFSSDSELGNSQQREIFLVIFFRIF